MELPAKLTVNGEHGPVDIADQAFAQNDARDLPVPAGPHIRQAADTGHARGFAAGLAAQRLVRELGQFRMVLPDRHSFQSPSAQGPARAHHWRPSPSNSRARASVMLRMHSPAS